MNKYLLLFLLLPAVAVQSQEGIRFSEDTWSKLLQRAADEQKLIFLDAYTTWCGPCKMMSQDVFPDKALGRYYNEHFINVQLDMESAAGYPLAGRYQIRAYPSLLYIDGQGQVVHRAVGYHGADQLLEVGQAANDPEQNLAGLVRRYAAGERDPDFLLKLAMAHSNAMTGEHMEALEAYFRTQKDWRTPENMELLFALTDNMDSPLFDYLANHRTDFELLFGREAVIGKLQQIISQALYLQQGEMPSLEQIDQLYARAYPDMADKLSARFRIDYFRTAGDHERFLEATAHYLETYSSEDAMELNNAAWNFFELCDDADQLEKALGWARKSVALAPGYYNYDTLAALYYKLGEKKKALKTAKQAIAMAKAEGEDYSATQALLEAIKTK